MITSGATYAASVGERQDLASDAWRGRAGVVRMALLLIFTAADDLNRVRVVPVLDAPTSQEISATGEVAPLNVSLQGPGEGNTAP